MSQTVQAIQSKMLDLFFAIRTHNVAFQPIVELSTGELHEYECLFRPNMPRHPASISAVVDAAIATGRAIELDTFIVRQILDRIGDAHLGQRRARRGSTSRSPSTRPRPASSTRTSRRRRWPRWSARPASSRAR